MRLGPIILYYNSARISYPKLKIYMAIKGVWGTKNQVTSLSGKPQS